MRGEPVTRIRAGASPGADRYNKPIPGPDVESPAGEALFDPGGTREAAEPGRAPVTTEPTLYFRGAFPDLCSGDRVRVRGVVFMVQGDRSDWDRPGARARGAVVELRKVDG